jgi:hypothetical protein
MVFVPIYLDRWPKCEEMRNYRAMNVNAAGLTTAVSVGHRGFWENVPIACLLIRKPLIKWRRIGPRYP